MGWRTDGLRPPDVHPSAQYGIGRGTRRAAKQRLALKPKSHLPDDRPCGRVLANQQPGCIRNDSNGEQRLNLRSYLHTRHPRLRRRQRQVWNRRRPKLAAERQHSEHFGDLLGQLDEWCGRLRVQVNNSLRKLAYVGQGKLESIKFAYQCLKRGDPVFRQLVGGQEREHECYVRRYSSFCARVVSQAQLLNQWPGVNRDQHHAFCHSETRPATRVRSSLTACRYLSKGSGPVERGNQSNDK